MNAEDENKKLRELLWLRHGCSVASLYGDDGEMQCGICSIDFKRMSTEDIERMWRSKHEPNKVEHYKVSDFAPPIISPEE